jgi:hypothetical protein
MPLEWYDAWYGSFRHWWEDAGDEPAMFHRASGEKIVFREEVSPEVIAGLCKHSDVVPVKSATANRWARFDYVFAGQSYPFLIEIRRVRYPNPYPDRYAQPPYNGIREPVLDLTVWRLDHILSAMVWQSEQHPNDTSDAPPPYTLWRLAERAMVDAALLWPAKRAVLPRADELAINGGWINGNWSREIYRRHRPKDVIAFRSMPAPSTRTLPLSEYTTVLPFQTSPKWKEVVDASIGFSGERREDRAPLLRKRDDGTVIGKVRGEIPYRFNEYVGAIGACRDDLYVILQMISSNKINHLEGWPPGINSGALSPSWNVWLDGYCSMGLKGKRAGQPSFIAKAVRNLDSISLGRIAIDYSADAVSHPLMSFDLYQWLYDCLLNALPFSHGFETETPQASERQGDVGRILIQGGYIGGMELLATEVRLKLRIPGDDDTTSWAGFFE